MSASNSTGAPSSATKQSSKPSKTSHNTDRAARSKKLDKEGKYGPGQQSHGSSFVSDKISNASRVPHNNHQEVMPRWDEGQAVYIPYDDDWMRDGRNVVLYICAKKIENGQVVYLLKDKPCNHPQARTVFERMPEDDLEGVPRDVEIRADGTAAVEG